MTNKMTKREKELIEKINSTGPLHNYVLTEREGRIFRRLARRGLVVGFDTSPRLWIKRWEKLKEFWDRHFSRTDAPTVDSANAMYWPLLGALVGIMIMYGLLGNPYH